MRARYYSPTLKRFINADTLKGSINDGETLNNYAYANGNPISMVDPFGRCADEANDESESIFSEIGGFSSNLYNKLNDDTIYVTGYDIDFNLNALSMGEYGALAETGEDVLKGADELGEFLSKGADKAETISHPVLDNTRTGSALKPYDGQHGFNDIIDNYAKDAQKFDLIGGDKVQRELYQIEGGQKSYEYKQIYDKTQGFNSIERTTVDQDGIFEWIVDPTEGVTHRRFIPGGEITGKPNQIPGK
jgi:hypothetical protein